MTERQVNLINEAITILNNAMFNIPDIASEVKAPLDGMLALSYAKLKMVRDILNKVTEEA